MLSAHRPKWHLTAGDALVVDGVSKHQTHDRPDDMLHLAARCSASLYAGFIQL